MTKSRMRGVAPRIVLALGAVATMCVAVGALGCGQGLPQCNAEKAPSVDYLRVDYTMGGEANKPPQVEVNPTPSYEAKRSALKAVAIRAPNDCLNTTAGQASGMARSAETETVLKTTCGVYLKEFESALAKVGFRVFSWDAVQQLERTKGSTYEAAKELGADAVFIFNSVDVESIKPGDRSRARMRYLRSNVRGDNEGPFVTSENDPVRSYLHDFVKSHSAVIDPNMVTGLACTVDVTAVLVTTQAPQVPQAPTPQSAQLGAPPAPAPAAPAALPPPRTETPQGVPVGESIWFYRRTHTKPLVVATGRRFLFAGVGGRFAPVRPEGLPVVQQPRDNYSDEDVETSAHDASAKDPYQKEKLDLIRDAAKDFVERFMHGNSGGANGTAK